MNNPTQPAANTAADLEALLKAKAAAFIQSELNALGAAPVNVPTFTLPAVGRYGHWLMLGLAGVSWLGEHVHIIGDQAQGTIQVTIVGLALAKAASFFAARLGAK